MHGAIDTAGLTHTRQEIGVSLDTAWLTSGNGCAVWTAATGRQHLYMDGRPLRIERSAAERSRVIAGDVVGGVERAARHIAGEDDGHDVDSDVMRLA